MTLLFFAFLITMVFYGFIFLKVLRDKIIERRETRKHKGKIAKRREAVYTIEMPDVIIKPKR